MAGHCTQTPAKISDMPPTTPPLKYLLSPEGTEFVLEKHRGIPIRKFPTVADAVDHLQTLPETRGAVLLVFNSYGRAELQLNL
jgi:hypothetical protein